jgi:prepilin-type N-terminal cleavage/methylation domain-containing protein
MLAHILADYIKLMGNSKLRLKGFSLVELMIVIVIIGILAAVAVPIYSNNVMKAKRSEADAALGSIRTQLDIFWGEYGRYPKERIDEYVIGSSWNDISPGELSGKYFSDSSYTYYGSPNGKVFKLTCTKGNILDYNRTLDQDGVLADE